MFLVLHGRQHKLQKVFDHFRCIYCVQKLSATRHVINCISSNQPATLYCGQSGSIMALDMSEGCYSHSQVRTWSAKDASSGLSYNALSVRRWSGLHTYFKLLDATALGHPFKSCEIHWSWFTCHCSFVELQLELESWDARTWGSKETTVAAANSKKCLMYIVFNLTAKHTATVRDSCSKIKAHTIA